MIVEQIQQEIKDKKNAIEILKDDIRDLEIELCKLSPYQPGDKVKIVEDTSKYHNKTADTRETIVYIGAVKPHYEHPWTYILKGVRKDGSMSQQGAGIYYYPDCMTIEKVTE